LEISVACIRRSQIKIEKMKTKIKTRKITQQTAAVIFIF